MAGFGVAPSQAHHFWLDARADAGGLESERASGAFDLALDGAVLRHLGGFMPKATPDNMPVVITFPRSGVTATGGHRGSGCTHWARSKS